MSTVNVNVLEESNKRIGKVINILGEILYTEDHKVYEQLVIKLVYPTPGGEKETEFLHTLYQDLIEKLKNIDFTVR